MLKYLSFGKTVYFINLSTSQGCLTKLKSFALFGFTLISTAAPQV